jgi:hypothetical protein
MNTLPIESTRWREHFKERIQLEAGILRTLIRWGTAESASDICRSLEEHLEVVLERAAARLPQPVWLSAREKAFVQELLREAYLRTREIPRHRLTEQRLHQGLLTAFEEPAREIVQCYERFFSRTEIQARSEKAA